MKKFLAIFLVLYLFIPLTTFASESMDNIYSFDDENVIVNMTEGYKNDLIFNENYDYSLSYDEDDNFETMSLNGKVIEASEPFEYNNGYVTNIVQNLKV